MTFSHYVQYTVHIMTQLINVTYARNNFAKVLEDISDKKKTVILIRDSKPYVIISHYSTKALEKTTLKPNPAVLLQLDTSWFDEKEYKMIHSSWEK